MQNNQLAIKFMNTLYAFTEHSAVKWPLVFKHTIWHKIWPISNSFPHENIKITVFMLEAFSAKSRKMLVTPGELEKTICKVLFLPMFSALQTWNRYPIPKVPEFIEENSTISEDPKTSVDVSKISDDISSISISQDFENRIKLCLLLWLGFL